MLEGRGRHIGSDEYNGMVLGFLQYQPAIAKTWFTLILNKIAGGIHAGCLCIGTRCSKIKQWRQGDEQCRRFVLTTFRVS